MSIKFYGCKDIKKAPCCMQQGAPFDKYYSKHKEAAPNKPASLASVALLILIVLR